MKRAWNVPDIEELKISATADATSISTDFDGDWEQIDGVWYRPGASVSVPV